MLAETLEKLCRMELWLEGVEHLASTADLTVIGLLKERVTHALGFLRESIQTLLTKRGAISPQGLVGIETSIEVALLHLRRVHSLLRYVPSTELEPEPSAFVAGICAWVNQHQRILEPSISLSLNDAYNFSELDVARVLEKDKGDVPGTRQEQKVVLLLPKIESHNPLSWPLLVHEVGHAIDAQHGLSADICEGYESTGAEVQVFERWTREFCADLIALRIVGPAYYASYAAFPVLSEELNKPFLRHPPTSDRLALMGRSLNDRQLGNDVKEFYEAVVTDRSGEQQPLDFSEYHFEHACPVCKQTWSIDMSVDVDAEHLRQTVETMLDEKELPTFDRRSWEKSETLAAALGERIPIGSSMAEDKKEELRADVVQAMQCVSDDDEGLVCHGTKVPELLARMVEKPSEIAQIVNAAWIHKCRRGECEFDDIFADGTADFHGQIRYYGDHISAMDRLLCKSIQTAQVHRMFKV